MKKGEECHGCKGGVLRALHVLCARCTQTPSKQGSTQGDGMEIGHQAAFCFFAAKALNIVLSCALLHATTHALPVSTHQLVSNSVARCPLPGAASQPLNATEPPPQTEKGGKNQKT